LLPAFVEVAEAVAAQGGRSALSAVDFYVLATGNAMRIQRHNFLHPPLP